MSDLFDLTSRPDPDVFFSRHDVNDPRLGELVSRDENGYTGADIVIVGCPQDEGVRRNGGRVGAAAAPNTIRRQFYKLTPFNIKKRICDVGDVKIGATLEETHDTHCEVVKRILRDGKRVIVLGGGNDISYPDGVAMAEVFGPETWIGINIDAHLDVRIAQVVIQLHAIEVSTSVLRDLGLLVSPEGSVGGVPIAPAAPLRGELRAHELYLGFRFDLN